MSNNLSIRGTVKTIMDVQTFESGFSKQEFVVTTADQYPQDVKFECVKDRISQLANIQQGQTVKVAFNVRGNEYNGRYYVNLQAWRIEADTTPQAVPADTQGGSEFDATAPKDEPTDDSSGFPF